MYVRRASFVLAVALAALAPAARTAAAQPAPSSGGANQWGVLVGVEDLSDSGVSLRGDLVLPLRPISPEVGFAIVPSIGYSHFSNSWSDPFSSVAGVSVDESLNLFRGMAAARFTFGHHPVIHPYADAGLGLYVASYGYEYHDTYYGTVASSSHSDLGLVMRFAGGVNFQVSPNFALGAELGFQPYFSGPDTTSTNLLFSAAFRM
jgi:opacity protein-like surface antigen